MSRSHRMKDRDQSGREVAEWLGVCTKSVDIWKTISATSAKTSVSTGFDTPLIGQALPELASIRMKASRALG